VNDVFTLNVESGFEIAGPAWKAFVTAVSLRFIRNEFNKHKTKLFSANVRDYLGSISAAGNINNGIRKTAQEEPGNFWAYNNGLTILVNSFSKPEKMKSGRIKFTFSGMSIVNGAQTTGAVAGLVNAPPITAKVPVRFVQTSDSDIVYDIIRYNNSQNKIAASDFRSTDPIQRRLKDDMAKIPGAEYEGGRRGGITDVIRRRPNLLSSYTVGQALAALYGEPTIAYNQKTDIWVADSLYARYFNENTTAAHIVFAYSLFKSVEAKKISLVNKSKVSGENLTKSEVNQLAFLRRRGATFLLVSSVASCIEIISGKKIPNIFRVSFSPKISPEKGSQIWNEIVETTLPLCVHLEEAFTYGLQNQDRVKTAIQKFNSLVEVTSNANAGIYKKFSSALVLR